jgi:SAM-dependent methyltransferase
MSAKVDLYNNAYSKYSSEVYRQIRTETYGQDLGQTSWVTQEESGEIPGMLHLEASSSVLEIGCGSGAYALQLAKTIGCSIVGLDVNESGVQNANQLAETTGLAGRARFEHVNASETLPFENDTFDAVFANDVLCHIPERHKVLSEMLRVLKRGGRVLFSDALIIGGLVTHEEIANRSSIGYYVYSPPTENERLMKQAGFREIRTTDTTESAALISKRWLQAREARSADLVELEGAANFKGLQAFLSCVHRLTSERRLLRYLYLAEKAL